jgi:hypothetical protein
MAFSPTRLALQAVPLALTLTLAACGGIESSTSSTGSASSATSASCSAYVDVISSTVRSNANADAQCSVQIANADSYLAAAKAACAKGDTATATTYYTHYQKTADYATSVVKTLCPGSSSSSNQSPTLPVTTYNLFVCRSSSNTVTNGTCTTSSSTPTSSCSGTWYNAGGSYTTLAACSADASSRYGLK